MSEETLSRIAGWCEAERAFEIEGSTLTVAGDPPLALALEISSDALTLAHVHSETGPPRGFAEKAVDMLTQRGSMIAGEVVTGTDSTAVHIRYPIYLEGLNRQSFLVGVREITGTVDGLNRLTESATSQPVEQPAAETATRPAPPPSQPDPEPVTAAAPVAAAAPAPWSATHQVPATGMAAWSDPDPSLAPVTTLGGGVQLRVDEQRTDGPDGSTPASSRRSVQQHLRRRRPGQLLRQAALRVRGRQPVRRHREDCTSWDSSAAS